MTKRPRAPRGARGLRKLAGDEGRLDGVPPGGRARAEKTRSTAEQGGMPRPAAAEQPVLTHLGCPPPHGLTPILLSPAAPGGLRKYTAELRRAQRFFTGMDEDDWQDNHSMSELRPVAGAAVVALRGDEVLLV